MDDLYRKATRAVATVAIPALVGLSLAAPASAEAASSNPLIANAKVVADSALDEVKGTGPTADYWGRLGLAAATRARIWGFAGITRSGSSEETAYYNARNWSGYAYNYFNRAYFYSPR